MATTVRVMKTAGYTRVAIEHCIVAMLPRSAVKDLDRAVDSRPAQAPTEPVPR